MIRSILAGLTIALAAGIYLVVGGPLGAFMFSLGLLTILHFQFYLFTGKAGLLAQYKITPAELLEIYIGNLIGCASGALALQMSGLSVSEPASAIIETRISNLWFENIILGIFCGVLMYVAVNTYTTTPYVTILCVASFILLGANHCIADMVYMFLAATEVTFAPMVTAILCSTIGNIIGCNMIPYSQQQSASSSS